MHIWCSAFLCLVVSVGYTAAITKFTSTEAPGAKQTVDPVLGDITDVPIAITLDEDFTGTITTFGVTDAGIVPTWSSSNKDIDITDSGVVTATLDYETSKSMTATITYSEGGTAAGTIILTLTVTDVNDPPVFDPIFYAQTVADGSGAGTSITTVTGSDAEDAKTVTYEISAGDTEGVFEVVTNAVGNGEIKIATGKSVDLATQKFFMLVVQVKDAGTPGTDKKTGMTMVAIGVCSSAVRAVATSLAVLLAVAIVILP